MTVIWGTLLFGALFYFAILFAVPLFGQQRMHGKVFSVGYEEGFSQGMPDTTIRWNVWCWLKWSIT